MPEELSDLLHDFEIVAECSVQPAEIFFEHLVLWLDPQPHDGPWNMAVDQALLEQSRDPVLRIYSWNQSTVSLGYAQSLEKLKPSLPDWPVVRRWTGGGVVFHDADITYSVIVPASIGWSQTRPIESYRLIHESLAKAMVDAGFAGYRLARKEDVIDRPFCFEAPAVHDIVRGTAKIAGAGQRRSRMGLLHQGSVRQSPLGAAFWRRWAGQLAPQASEIGMPGAEVMHRADELAALRYGTDAWLWHREDAKPDASSAAAGDPVSFSDGPHP